MEKEFAMNKLLSALAAGMLVLVMNGFTVAQDEPQMTPRDVQQDTQPDVKAQPVQPGDLSATDREYFAALKKCESLSGSQKTQCIDTAKKKFGQM